MSKDKENTPKPKLIFTKDNKKQPPKKIVDEDTYFEDTAKAIVKSKIAIDSHAGEEGGGHRSVRFQRADKKNTSKPAEDDQN